MTQTCETCRYFSHGSCWGHPRACTVEPDRPACSLYRARVSDKEREAEEAVIWAAREQAQADVASMLGKAYSCVKPSEYNIKCAVKPSYDQLAAAVVAARNLLKTQLEFPGMPDMCISAFEALKAMGDLEESS